MAVTYAQFIIDFPEFASAPQPVVEYELGVAARSVNSAMFAEQANDAIALLAAHKMALRPGGEFARLQTKDGTAKTTFGEQYKEMLTHVAPGDRVP